MKKMFFILAVVACLSVATFAQTKKAEQSRAWKRFQTAIGANDKRAVATMIAFPFGASIVPENLNFKIENEADFLVNYDAVFNRSRRLKIARGKIVSVPGEDEFNFEMLENGAYHVFTFRKTDDGYKLVETMAAG